MALSRARPLSLIFCPPLLATADSLDVARLGLLLIEFNRMLLQQGGVRASCGLPETVVLRGKVKQLSLDHCHTTNRDRALLCAACNTTLGMMNEDPARIGALADYIERHKQRLKQAA
jgi:hypothetical protein